MKIAILETGHFQYSLTQAEIFSECEKTIITTNEIKKDIIDYSAEFSDYDYVIIESIAKNEIDIINIIKKRQIDLFLISPVFDSYAALKRIVKKVACKKVLTTHNINTWFYGRFWSPKSYLDRVNMRAIINNCDYIAIEDFIYNHLKTTNDILLKKHTFIYIPFTVFHQSKIRKYSKENMVLKVVLTGAIDGDRRNYDEVLEVIHHFKKDTNKISFSFAGRAKGDYGITVQNKLREIKKSYPTLVSFFENDSTVDMFRKEMETSDIVLSTSIKTFKGMGTMEYIGKTKPTAAIHDMMSYELPGLLPSHLKVPEKLIGSVFNYNSAQELINILENLIGNNIQLEDLKMKAKVNSLNFTAKEIRKQLPF